MSPTIAEVDLDAIRNNCRAVRDRVGSDVRVMPVVKANAYGHGAVKVTKAVLEAGADMLAVARIEEALELREAGVDAPVLILGCSPPEAAREMVDNDVTATVCDLEFARALSASAQTLGKAANTHVKIDTGMGRIGVGADDAIEFILSIRSLPGIHVEGVFTHFPSADEDDSGFTEGQIGRFRGLLEELGRRGARPPIAHAANSGGILDHPESYFDMVRPGLLVYGVYPSSRVSRSVTVTPALAFKTRVAFRKQIAPGETVSYGRTFRAEHRTTVATIPVGYADGLSRHLSNRGCALLRGRRVPIIGRVCMDQTMLDVSDVADAQKGDEVVLYGSQDGLRISVEEIAELTGTVPHDVLCAVGPRVPRVYCSGAQYPR